jgi:hypothetical protein
VRIIGGQLPNVVDKAEKHLIESTPDLYQRAHMIVRPAWTQITTFGGGKISSLSLVPIDVFYMMECFTATSDFQKFDKRSYDWKSVDCTKDIANVYLSRTASWKLPTISAIINAPTLLGEWFSSRYTRF